jgi:Flp pilus assembly pilin Flp
LLQGTRWSRVSRSKRELYRIGTILAGVSFALRLRGAIARESVVKDQIVRFLRDEEGLVTLEWVALAAAVIVLAIGVIVVIQTNLNTAASTIGSKIVSTVNSNS